MRLMTFNDSRTLIPMLLLYSSLAFSQQRMIDQEAICVSPAGEVINGGRLPLDFGMLNHGPDPRYGNDTMWYSLTSILHDGYVYQGYSGLLVGGSPSVIPIDSVWWYREHFKYDIQYRLTGIDTPYTVDECVTIAPFAINSKGDTVRRFSHYDPDLSNNTCCKKVTILPKSSSIAQDIRQNAEGVWVYPNPVRDRLHIRTSAGFSEKGIQITICDVSGRLLKEQRYVEGTLGEDTWSVDVADIPEGIYHVHLQSSKGVLSRKIVIGK